MNTNTFQNINVGVDTDKSQLDIYIRPLDIYFSVPNDKNSIAKAIKIIKKHSHQRVVIKATGRLEMPFIMACADAKLPYVIANPLHVKKFAGAIGRKAKNDSPDAELIAHYAEAIKPELTQLKPEKIRLMSDLVARRNQLLTMQTMEKNRLQIIELCPEYQAKNTILQSMPGIGKIAAASIISNVPELGYITNKQAASLIGVAPITRESGRYKGKRIIQGGRHQVRTVLFMAMMSAMQCNPIFKATYQRLLDAGKPKKVAIIACVRKMVVILNSMLRDSAMLDENTSKN